jgi:ABC-type uncharacterized transport system permease subunit
MPDLLLYFITAACWLALSAMAFRATRPAVAAVPGPGEPRFDAVLVPVALMLHGMLVYRGIHTTEGLDLGVANASSLIVWLTVLIYWLGGLVYTGVAGILGLMAPVAAAAVLLQAVLPSGHVVTYGGNPVFAAHFGILLGYSLFIVATVHALVMLAEGVAASRHAPPLLRSLPPCSRWKRCSSILLAAFVMLTLTVVSEVFFSVSFGKAFKANHKTVFTFISMAIFGGLLWGHHFRGWRGRGRLDPRGFHLLLHAASARRSSTC